MKRLAEKSLRRKITACKNRRLHLERRGSMFREREGRGIWIIVFLYIDSQLVIRGPVLSSFPFCVFIFC
jgi:hypothetical protein